MRNGHRISFGHNLLDFGVQMVESDFAQSHDRRMPAEFTAQKRARMKPQAILLKSCLLFLERTYHSRVMKFIQFLTCCAALSVTGWAQSSSPLTDSPKAATQKSDMKDAQLQPAPEEAKTAKNNNQLHLTAVNTVVAPSDASGLGGGNLQCDDDGNIYIDSDSPAYPGIRKLNSKGELVATFKPDTNPDVKVEFSGDFFVTREGEVYQWVGEKDSSNRYVLVFKNDGSYKSAIKLDPGFAWMPANLSVFAHGEMLLTGQQFARVNGTVQPAIPFTGIFSADGRLLKRLDMEGDGPLKAAALASTAPATALPGDHTIAWGHTTAVRDGNIYVMRWASPAAVDAISPGGEVVRSFTVDSGMNGVMPRHMHASGNRLAIWFTDFHGSSMLKIVDLEGNEIAAYEAQINSKNRFGEFGCYTAVPERFTFISNQQGKIYLQEVEAR
jgi:hypothetical protein